MKVVKTIIKYVIAIVIAISMILFFITNLASSTILNKKYILAKLEETDYYNKIYEEVESNFENYIHQSGLEEKVLEDIISKEKIRKDTQLIIGNVYDGLEEKIDTQELKDNLNQNIEETLGKTKQTEAQKKAINTLVDKISKEYETTMSHYEKETQIYKLYAKVMKYLEVVKKITLITTAVSVVILLLLSIRRIYKLFSLLGVSATTIGTFFIIVNYFINMKIKVQTILILNDAVSATVRSILTEILHSINQYGYIMLGAGLLMIIGANLIHNAWKYKKELKKKEV